MGKRRRILPAALILVILGGLTWILLPPAEAVYGGKPLHVWIDVLESVSPGIDPPPVWQELGPDELPVLIKILEMGEGRFQQTYRKMYSVIWPKLPVWVLRRLSRPRNSEDIAINALLLLQTLRGRQSEVKIDMSPAIPGLIYAMKANKSSVVRGMAAYCLGNLGAGNKAASDALVAALNDKDPHVHDHAAAALNWVHPAADAKAGVK